MNKREREIRLRLKTDFIHYAAKCLNVRTKQGAIVVLRLNAAQKHIHECLERQLQETGRVRAVIVKGRQQGVSTYVQARFYWKLTHAQGLRAFILTHLDAATRNLYQIVRRFYDYCPLPVRPHASRANSRELAFDRLDSDYHVGTARTGGVGRSNTVQLFHGSEVAYWTHAADHMAGIFQSVPDAPGTEIILESTSNGASGKFHALCEEARAGRTSYQFIFVPWFWQPEYRRAPPPDFVASAEEAALQKEFNLDAAQLYWRRLKIDETGSIWTFRREYPATPEEAFHADRPGALWNRAMLQANRRHDDALPEMKRIVVAVDPATTANRNSDETGIIVAGLGVDGHAYVLDDISGKYTPAEWASRVIDAYYRHRADRVVAEVNQGGDMVEHTLRSFDRDIAYKAVHASRGKIARAEPIAALDAAGRIHHAGIFGALEDQMCRFDPAAHGPSPDRVDARVWAMTELMLNHQPTQGPKMWRG